MELPRTPEPTGPPETPDAGAPAGRDPDLGALEGLEAQFTELEAELERVEGVRGAGVDDASA